MSFPSQGIDGMYRNKIKDVANFLDEKHKTNYKVYNLCSERAYDASNFHGRVERFYIDDHNVPTLSEAIRFIKSVKEWTSKDIDNNIIAVHCKGGKGRTGTMISMWLLESKVCKTAQEALNMFGERRTDLDKGNKFQGVETPSQSRFVEYYEKILDVYNGDLPPRRELTLDKIILHSINGIGNSDGSDLTILVYSNSKQLIMECDLAENTNCKRYFNEYENKVIISEFKCDTKLFDEVKVMFKSKNKVL